MPKLKMNSHKKPSLIFMLISLTVLIVAAQLALFFVHYQVSDLLDSLTKASISSELFHAVLILPLMAFVVLQIIAYILFVTWIWLISISVGEICKLRQQTVYGLGLCCWFIGCAAILTANRYFYPGSFFAHDISSASWLVYTSNVVLVLSALVLLTFSMIAVANFFWCKRHKILSSVFILLGVTFNLAWAYDKWFFTAPTHTNTNAMPNIIFIGLDSLRPDFIHYFGNQTVHTPHIDHFLQTATIFTQAYTPLARTFPAWASILTSQYPKHNGARNNLVNPTRILASDTLAKRLQQAGYVTMYATDEKRFSNITSGYGFDRIIGPSMGVNDFLLGGLTDFPLTNLLVNLPISRFLFPYNYSNRAAAITYEPDSFLKLVKHGLANRPNKPLFLSVHLCLTHWPFTWARDGQDGLVLSDQYRNSIAAIDTQLGQLFHILQANKLLDNSVIVLLSDHGTSIGLPGDRFITQQNYRGEQKKIKLIPVAKLSATSLQKEGANRDYTINTSYGQGTDVLSLKQYHVLLTFKFPGKHSIPAQQISVPSSLLDIAPTVLELLQLPGLKKIDGVSLHDYVMNKPTKSATQRALFMETGDSITEIETDHIYIEKVVKHEIGIYKINPSNGLLFMSEPAEQSLIKNKQHSILMGEWLLARYPARIATKLVPFKKGSTQMRVASYALPTFFVLANVKTGLWTIDLSNPLVKSAPLPELMHKLKDFYGDEV